ncbi:MAG: N-acetylmuramoyl-L-alanine amidase [Bacteroidales bacterium]|jgi:N-acetylmuramoyl-L-alanine amidase|nr:N-acetylmuramoyl-L-alanine amidase [Bacteroidales bacterium]
MKTKQIIQITLILAAVLSGCKTTQLIQPVAPVEQRTAQPQVVELDLTGLFPSDFSGRKVTVNKGAMDLTTDSEGKITFDMPETDTILLSLAPCPDLSKGCDVSIPVTGWFVPYKYSVKPDGSVERKSPWVEFRMTPEAVTSLPQFDFLCKSEYPATVSINGIELKQYKTGIFFTTVKFDEGVNRVRAEATTPDGRTAVCEQEFIYEKRDMTRQSYPLWLDKRSFEPATDMELLPGEVVKVSFRASKGQEVWLDIRPGKRSIKCVREDFNDYSIYRAEVPSGSLATGTSHALSVRLIPASGAPVKDVYRSDFERTVIVRNPEAFPLVRVKNEYSRLVYNLGAPRLGGPIRSELGPGVILKVNGKIGRNYRVRLSNTEIGFISEDDVELTDGIRVQPSYSVTSMSCGPAGAADMVSIPWLEPVPYEVYPDPDGKRLVVTIFGAETAATWVSHRTGCRVIDKLTWEQTSPETFRVFVNLKTEDIWGYDIQPSGKSLVLRVKYPPSYDLSAARPLTGLKIAIEAGHGGSGTGAIGLSGLVEKEINLDLSFRLGDLCAAMGAEVIQVRDSDRDMTLTEKRNIAIGSGADMLISIHANAGGRGYLSVAGTSTYWHNPFWAPLAQTIYDRLLETGLPEFGVVGSFNYTVTRVSQMPSVLVEQAFMTHAEDEEKLADPDFRQQMAQKIYEGIIDYLKMVK